MRKSVIPESDDMNLATPVNDPLRFSFHEIILQQGELISDKLNMLRFEHYPPNAAKGLRSFSLSEVAYFLGVTPSNIKKLHLEGKGPAPTTSSGGALIVRNRCLSCANTSTDTGALISRNTCPTGAAREPLQVIPGRELQGRQR